MLKGKSPAEITWTKFMTKLYSQVKEDEDSGTVTNTLSKNFVISQFEKFYPKVKVDARTVFAEVGRITRAIMQSIDANDVNDPFLTTAFKLADRVYPALWPKLSTLDNNFTNDVRVIMRDRYTKDSPQHMKAKEEVALTWEQKAKLEEGKNKKVVERNRNPIRIDGDLILDYIRNNIVSTDPLRKGVALLVASGSRPVELFLRSNYTEYNDEYSNGYWVEQTRIAKKRGLEVTVKKPIIYITAAQFIEELAYVRAELKKKYGSLSAKNDSDKLNPSITSASNTTAKNVFGNDFGDLHQLENKQYTSRKLYANMSYELYCRDRTTVHGQTVAYPHWVSNVLGHDGTGTLSNYAHVYITFKKELPEGLSTRQNLLEKKVEQLEERLEEKQVPPAEVKPLPTVSASEEAVNKLKPLFNKYIKEQGRRPSQAAFEKMAKGILPRATVRTAYKTLYRQAD